MGSAYFSKFRTVPYGGRNVLNLTERAVILNRVFQNPYVWYPYDVLVDERPDQFADRYYGDSFLSWLVYLSNTIIDPYYQWPLSQNEFNAHVIDKYGSLEAAQRKIVFLRNNWYILRETINPSTHAALDVQELKYWDPNYGTGARIISYGRKPIDWIVNTNRIVRYDIANTAGSFSLDQKVTVSLDASHSGNAQVIVANSSTITVQHVEGTVLPNTSVVISANSVLSTDTGNTHIANAHLLANNLDPVEEKYWDRVSAFDVEMEQNSANRSIRVLDSQYAPQVSLELKKLLGPKP